MTSGEGVNAFVDSAFRGYDAMTNRIEVGKRRVEDREQRATKAKQDAELYKQTLANNKSVAEMSERKNKAQAMMMDTVPQSPSPEIESLKAEIASLKKITEAQTASTAINAVKAQVFAPDSQATLPHFNATVSSNPALVELFGDTPARMPDLNNVDDTKALYNHLSALGIKPTPEAAKKAVGTGLLYMGEDGIVDSRGLMAAMGAHKTFTPEEQAKYEQLNKQLHGTDEVEKVDNKAEESKESASMPATPSDEPEKIDNKAEESKEPMQTTDGTGTGTQVGYVEPTEEELNAMVDAKIAANQQVAEANMTEPQKAVISKLDNKMTPEQKNTLRLIAGYGDTPKTHTSATAELYDIAKQLTPDEDTFDSPEDYDAALKNTFEELKFKKTSMTGGGPTSITRTMTEMADKVNNPGKYTPAEVTMAKNWIDAHNPAKTGTIRNKEYEAGQGMGSLAPSGTTTLGLPPLPAGFTNADGTAKAGKGPLIGPSGKSVPNALTPSKLAEETQFNMYNPTAKETSFKKEKGEFVQNAQGVAELKKLQSQIKNLYRGGKMTAGPVDNFLTSFNVTVPYLSNGQVDQVAAEAKIKQIVAKTIKASNGANASNKDVERAMETMFGPTGSQEPIRLKLFNDYVDSTVNSYNDTRQRMINNKQHSIVKQADDIINKAKTKPAFVEGRVYKDAKGNKARYVNGKFEEIR